MTKIVVGSTALNYHCFRFRTANDIDIWTDEDHQKQKGEDVSIVPSSILSVVPHKEGYATPDAVYTIKLSHLGWDIFWDKHKRDVLWMEHNGCKRLPELYSALIEYWKEVHGNKDFLSLHKKKQDFFNDYVDYKYDHDYLHELVAYPDKPVYNMCLKDGEDVAIDKEKFFSLPFEKQIRMFKEEITVIALERWVIPYREHLLKAYPLALKKTVTSLTKNWATEFLVLNLKHFERPDVNLFQYAMKTLKEKQND